MRRLIAAMVGIGLVSSIGCMGRAEYVQKNKDGGIIALKIDADEAEARKLMEKHLGSNYEIVDRYDPKARMPTGTDLQPASKLGKLLPKDEAVTHIAYRKLPDSHFGGATPAGLPPAPRDGGLMQIGLKSGQPKPSTAGRPTDFGSEPGAITPPDVFPR